MIGNHLADSQRDTADRPIQVRDDHGPVLQAESLPGLKLRQHAYPVGLVADGIEDDLSLSVDMITLFNRCPVNGVDIADLQNISRRDRLAKDDPAGAAFGDGQDRNLQPAGAYRKEGRQSCSPETQPYTPGDPPRPGRLYDPFPHNYLRIPFSLKYFSAPG